MNSVDQVIVVGGQTSTNGDGASTSGEIWTFEPIGLVWREQRLDNAMTGTPPPALHSAAGCVVNVGEPAVEDVILLFGGEGVGGSFSNLVYVYAFLQDQALAQDERQAQLNANHWFSRDPR